jgi:hypothetical protein
VQDRGFLDTLVVRLHLVPLPHPSGTLQTHSQTHFPKYPRGMLG